MNIKQVKKEFKQINADFIKEHKRDKILLNFEWTCYCDMLCKSGILTLKQWQNLKNIF